MATIDGVLSLCNKVDVIIPPTSTEGGLYLTSYEGALAALRTKRPAIGCVFTIGSDLPLPKLRGVKHYTIECEDTEDTDLLRFFGSVNTLIDNCRLDGMNVLVHCLMGVSRSATIVIAYVMHRMGLLYNKATEYVLNKRFIIAPNKGFVRQLKIHAINCYETTPLHELPVNDAQELDPLIRLESNSSNYAF